MRLKKSLLRSRRAADELQDERQDHRRRRHFDRHTHTAAFVLFLSYFLFECTYLPLKKEPSHKVVVTGRN